MLFGNPASFAIEAIVEPGPDYSPIFGSNITGRVRVFVGGQELGRFSEPCCVLKPLAEHLCSFSDHDLGLWDQSLATMSPQEQFRALDQFLYLGTTKPTPEGILDTPFLTNVSEAFDGVKAFVVSTPGMLLHVLFARENRDLVHNVAVDRHDFASAAKGFANWWESQENELLRKKT